MKTKPIKPKRPRREHYHTSDKFHVRDFKLWVPPKQVQA